MLSMLGFVALVLVRTTYLQCLLAWVAASCEEKVFVGTLLACLRSWRQLAFDARLCDSSSFVQSLSSMLVCIGGSLL